jgi:hypothetical protein
MGEIEKQIRGSVRRTKINTALMNVLAVAGDVALGVLAPHVAGRLGRNLDGPLKQGTKRSFSKLMRYGYIALKQTASGKKAHLTEKGEKYVALVGEGKLRPKKPKYWDKKWRLLIFDIPEKRRGQRAQIRVMLVKLGFHRLQDSVWVYPYDCEDLITLLKVDLRIGKNLLYVVADAIEHDITLRTHFGLE